MRKSRFSLILLGSLMLGGCTTIMNNLPGVYTLDIQQGNRVSQDMINQLKPNMNKRQVLYIMGSPMLIDVFHKNRWDYLYSNQLGGEPREQARISLYFEGETLVGVQGDFKPVSNAKRVSKESTVNVPKRDLDQSLWGKTTRLFDSKEGEDSAEEIEETKTPEADDNKPEQSVEDTQESTEQAEENSEVNHATESASENKSETNIKDPFATQSDESSTK